MVKLEEKERAINMRKGGYSYREILEEVPVAKATLSLWLRAVGLSKRQKQRLTLKKLEAGRRGAAAQKNKRLIITKEIKEKAGSEIGHISKRELWLMGIMLYWAEGTKEKEDGRPTGVHFSNSDPAMLKLFCKWLVEICKIPENHIKYEIYIHESSKNRLLTVRKHWAEGLEASIDNFRTVYFKKHKINSSRKNIGSAYFGSIKIRVRKSTFFNRKIAGWIEGINKIIAG